jgi:hypothetical protein
MRIAVMAALVVGVACSGPDTTDAAGGSVRVDTLPNGAVRTMSSAPIQAGQWRLELLHRVQPAEGDSGELMQPQDLALTDDGTLLVSESGDAHVKVFDASGRFLRRIGRNGQGPGEFRVGFLAARGDTLLVQDPQTGRASTFRISDGAFLGSRPTTCCYWDRLGVDRAGRVVLPANHAPPDSASRSATAWVRLAASGTNADTVFVWQGRARDESVYWEIGDGETMMMRMPVPYVPREVETVDTRGGWITAWTGEYLLRATGSGDDTVALFGRPYVPEPVNGREKSQLVESRVAAMAEDGGPSEASLRVAMTADKIPDRRPAFERLFTDGSGRTWVARLTADTASHAEFDVFDAERRWLDVVRIPKSEWSRGDFSPIAWGLDRVAVVVENEEGRPSVLVYEIRRTATAAPD